MKKYILLPAILFSFINYTCAQHVSVLTEHNDNTRAGLNNRETKLTTGNVNETQFGKAFTLTVDDQVYSQPLVVADISANGKKYNVVYIATVNNSVYAFDADNGTLYWQRNYTVPGQRAPNHTDMTGACGGFYNDFSGNIGIVGTPVIDSAAQTMYFVARSTDGTNFNEYLHAINITTGNEQSGSPVLINATYSGTGDGGTTVTFNPQKSNQRQPLTLVNGTVYISFSSHCDWGPYHGWILGYDSKTLQQKIVYNDTPNGYEGGLWQSGGGMSADSLGNLYVVTGNGSVGTSTNRADLTNRGESALKLTPSGSTLAVSSFYTPTNFQALENSDLDYGSMAAFLIPHSGLYFTGCKDGNLYLLNKDNMGGYSSTGNNVQQTVTLTFGKTLRCQPAYFKGTGTENVYLWSENDNLRSYPINRTTNMLDIDNETSSSVSGPTGGSGACLSVSSNNGAAGTGILWAAYASNGDANQSVRPGILRAFDATNLSKELWDNTTNTTRDAAGNFAKFNSPTVANGHVYLATFSNQVVVYGVIDSTAVNTSCSAVNLALNKPAFASSIQSGSYPASNAFDSDTTTTRWSSAPSDPQYIYVDLGQIDSVCMVKLKWQAAYGKNFTIAVSNDTKTWTPVATITGNTSLANQISLKARGRYVAMYGTARGTASGYSLYDFTVNGKVLPACVPPDGLTFTSATPSTVLLKWNSTGAASYIIKYNESTSNSYKYITATTDSVILTGLGCGTNYNWSVAGICNGSSNTYSTGSVFSTANCVNCGLLPTRVYTQDIGNVNLAGEACFTGTSSYNVKGSGNDIGYNYDQFRYVFKTYSGDGTLQAKVTSQDATSIGNKAGLMFRESLDSGARFVFLGISSGLGVIALSRETTNALTTGQYFGNYKAPYYLRLVKKGLLFNGYISQDSIQWTQIFGMGNAMENIGGPISGGLAVTSNNNSKLSTVQFDQVSFYFDATTAPNLALNKPSYSSSNDVAADAANYGNDGNLSTRWASVANASPQWYYVDLGKQFNLHNMKIFWDTNYGTSYEIHTSNEGVSWGPAIQTISGNTVGQNSLYMNTTTRFIGIFGNQSVNGHGFSIDELQLYGDSVAGNNADIAKGKQTLASSTANATNTSSKITDGDFTTRWQSASSDPQWIGVDLGAVYDITNVNITWQASAGKNFQVQVSNDEVNWTVLKTITGNTSYANFIAVSGTGRYVRISCTTSMNAGYSIYDLQVMGSSSGSNALLINSATPANINQFVVSPNPTSGKMDVDFVSLQQQDIQMIVTNMAGHIYKTVTLSSYKGVYHSDMDITTLPLGNYVVSIKTATGFVGKVVIKK